VNVLSIVVAVVVGLVIVRVGFGMLRALATPLPEPPPAGELRRVKIVYRCSMCGTEVRMTVANDAMPDPPRHCMDEMDVLSTGD
jgi:hypothetical protein